MTNYYTNNDEALKIARKSGFIDTRIISKIFKKIKEKGILVDPIRINIDPLREIKSKKEKDLIDQIILNRKQKGYTREYLGEYLGVSTQIIATYETRKSKLNDPEKIRKLIDLLEIENPKITEYQEFLMQNPNAKIKQYMIENDITIKGLGKKTGIALPAIKGIVLENKLITEDQYNKLKKTIFNKIFKTEQNKKEIEYEDEEEKE